MVVGMDAAQRSLRSRLGGFATSARYDAREINVAARSAYRESFRTTHTCSVCKPYTMAAGLPESEIARRAEAVRRLHYLQLAVRSAQSRATTKAAKASRRTSAAAAHGGSHEPSAR